MGVVVDFLCVVLFFFVVPWREVDDRESASSAKQQKPFVWTNSSPTTRPFEVSKAEHHVSITSDIPRELVCLSCESDAPRTHSAE